jgi:2-keto-myo-inositol isomerase
MRDLLALHTWTLDTTPLPRVLEIARDTGWAAVELRRLDFGRAAQRGEAPEAVLDLVRRSQLATACVGVELGWMFATGEERARLLRAFDESCAWARALDCRTVMSPVDRGRGDLAQAVASVAEVGDIARGHGVRLALEFNSQCEQFNTLRSLRDLLARVRHPQVGLLIDAYHMERSGGRPADVDDVPAEDIVYVQFSDVPRSGLVAGQALDRLPPGRGSVPFPAFFAALARKGYAGFCSYEAPNPTAWARDPAEVAREAIEATRAVAA